MTKKERIQRAYLRMIDRSVRTPTGCLEYQGGKTKAKNGYASIHVGRTEDGHQIRMTGHRIAWILHHDKDPEGLVRHTCDNPACIEITHLLTGTHQDNSNDAKARGRVPRGENGSAAKLTNQQAEEIRLRYFTEKISQKNLAADYGVHQIQVSRIIARRTFAV